MRDWDTCPCHRCVESRNDEGLGKFLILLVVVAGSMAWWVSA